MRARGAIFPCALAFALACAAACTEERRTNGEDCLKDQDCLSGLCSGLKCAAMPPILDASALDASSAGDAAGDAGAGDAAADGGADGASAADAPADG